MARNAPELVATAWAEVMDATVIAEKGRSVILPEVALVTPRCILVPIGRQAMGAAQQLFEVLFGRLLDLQMRPVPVPASDLPAETTTHQHYESSRARLTVTQQANAQSRTAVEQQPRAQPPRSRRDLMRAPC